MKPWKDHVGNEVRLSCSGIGILSGFLADAGNDVVVVYEDGRFIYMPTRHIRQLELLSAGSVGAPSRAQNLAGASTGSPLEWDLVLQEAKGLYGDFYLEKHHVLDGELTAVQKEYAVLQSPIYRTVWVSLYHLKGIVPYNVWPDPAIWPIPEAPPISAHDEAEPADWTELIKGLEGQFVVLDTGTGLDKAGNLIRLHEDILELLKADGKRVFIHKGHVRCLTAPYRRG